MLMHHADAEVNGIHGLSDIDLLLTKKNLPFIRMMNPVQDVHQRGFAGAVFAEEGEDLSLPERQVYGIQRFCSGKVFRDITH